MELFESFGMLVIPLDKGMFAAIRQDGNTKCVALYNTSFMVAANEWTIKPYDITGAWVVFQNTEELIALLDDLTIYCEELGEEVEEI
jgi:hypothetical protein